MPSLQSPRGTRDLLPDDQVIWNSVKAFAAQTAIQMGYRQITTPTYEEVSLFQRSLGEETDVINKELFLVHGKNETDTHYALRPEGTAGIVRAFIEHGMHLWPQPVKFASYINCFRYERPQKGRYREHSQFDLEYFGDKEPFADAWLIYTTWTFLNRLGLTKLELRLNSLGTLEDRSIYIQKLKEYYTPLKDKLSPDSVRRLENNPLRLLDTKDANDQALRVQAPKLSEYLSDESNQRFSEVQEYLKKWKVPFVIDPFLVRGFDYYCHTAFEWTVQNKEGQQDSLGGGGRYDGLVTQLGGPDVGAVGAGMGLDRIVEEVIAQGKTTTMIAIKPQAYLIAADEAGKAAAPAILEQLIESGIILDTNLSKINLGNQLKQASKLGAQFAIIFGQNEIEEKMVMVKNLITGEQEKISIDSLVEYLQSRVSTACPSL